MFKLTEQLNVRVFVILSLAVFAGVHTAYANNLSIRKEPFALSYAGLWQLRQVAPELYGQDVTLGAVCRSMTYHDKMPQDDYRFNTDHRCFLGGHISFADGSNGTYGKSEHATAIGGLLLGFDEQAWSENLGNFQYEGLCPDANVEVFEFCRFISLNIHGHTPINVDVLTLSCGYIFEDWWSRGIDRIADEAGTVIVAGIGNGKTAYDPILYPAAGANTIGVGVIRTTDRFELPGSNEDFIVPDRETSSFGPTRDNRCKPDLVAPGKALVPSVTDNEQYHIQDDCTSLAGPIVAGTAALLVQKAKDNENLAPYVLSRGGNSLIKAVLMNSATKLPYWHKGRPTTDDDSRVPLDYAQGAGAVNAYAAYQLFTAGRYQPGPTPVVGWDQNQLTQDANVYNFRIKNPETDLITATLTWNRHYQDAYPFKEIPDSFDNLRLELWGIDPNEPGRNTLLNVSDSEQDNVEHLYTSADPNFIQYELVVTHSVTPETPCNERYALAWNVSEQDNNENIWWYDLNNDRKITTTDYLLLQMLDNNVELTAREDFAAQALNLTPHRLTLLKENWPAWRTHLTDFPDQPQLITRKQTTISPQ